MPNASDAFFKLAVISVVLIVLLIGGFVLVRRLRTRSGDTGVGTEPFTLQDLREMRASGKITEMEFEAMKAALIGRATAPRPTIKENARPEPPFLNDES